MGFELNQIILMSQNLENWFYVKKKTGAVLPTLIAANDTKKYCWLASTLRSPASRRYSIRMNMMLV